MPSAAQWVSRVRQWKGSGQSATEFAALHGWNAKTLTWWGSELARRARRARDVRLVRVEAEPPRFDAAVDGRPPEHWQPAGGGGVELVLQRGCVVRVRRGFDAELLRELVGALERS
jgi:hypothetical protein